MASAAADVAATDRSPSDLDPSAALIAAALALPGVLSSNADAQAAPDQGVIALRYYDYRDWQPGASRMSVRSPSLYAFVPLSDVWTVEGSVLHDTMSGASPLYHDTLSGASGLGITDYRSAAETADWAGHDPIDRLAKHLTATGALTEAVAAEIDAEAETLAAATRDAMNEEPELDPLELFDHVYAAPRTALLEQREFLARELADS